MVLDSMSQVASLGSEPEAIERILQLFVDLCEPTQVSYFSVVEGGDCRAYSNPPCEISDAIRERMCALQTEWEMTDSGAGFRLAVAHLGQRVGVLEVEGITRRDSLAHYLNLALRLVGVLGLSIANARTHDGLMRANHNAQSERDMAKGLLGLSTALNKISVTIGSTLDFSEIMRHVVIEAADATTSSRVGLLSRQSPGWKLAHGYGHDPEDMGRAFASTDLPFVTWAAEHRDVVWSTEAGTEAARGSAAGLFRDAQSIMCVPLIISGEVYGVLAFCSRRVGAYDGLQIDFARKLSSSLCLALRNAQLFETQRTIADTLQQALLVMPTRMVGVRFGHLYRASTTERADVGGDFYDLFDIDHRNIGIVIGDISGKGLEAAKLTSLVKDSIRAFAHVESSPAWVLDRTNTLLFESTSDTKFATVFFGILDTQTGEFAYCSAGHPSALIRSADGLVRALAVGSTIIGAFEEIEVRDGSECLGPGETLVLYTDGITEAHCADGLFGEERLIRALSLADVDPVEMPATLIAAIESYPDAVLPDDAALLCLQLSAPVSSCTRGA
jgi:hypothetical protein